MSFSAICFVNIIFIIGTVLYKLQASVVSLFV
jgi:hypothetical protein